MNKKHTKYLIVLIVNVIFAFLLSFIFIGKLANDYVYILGYGISIILVELPVLALFIYFDFQDKNNKL